jgi:REP element-mobilizing transposase RayT
MDDCESLSHTKWECKYHVVFIPKYRRKVLYFPNLFHPEFLLQGEQKQEN